MKISKEEKQRIKAERQRVHDIIKYDVNRKYFGDWTPDELNTTYNSPTPVNFYTGILSVDKICDALWNEMSYNPERFGTVSPFKFNGKNSLDFFINKEIDIYDNNFEVLTNLQAYLSRFLELALQYDKDFMITNRFKSTNILISTKIRPGEKPIPSATYRMLGYLRDSIHKIASQNLQDFENKAIYRNQIIETVKEKHPKLFRPVTPVYAVPVHESTNEELEKCISDKNYLVGAIWNKNSEIMDTQMRIDTLNEFENPGDTNNDAALLKKQKADLKNLETNLQLITQRIQKIKQQQYEH